MNKGINDWNVEPAVPTAPIVNVSTFTVPVTTALEAPPEKVRFLNQLLVPKVTPAGLKFIPATVKLGAFVADPPAVLPKLIVDGP